MLKIEVEMVESEGVVIRLCSLLLLLCFGVRFVQMQGALLCMGSVGTGREEA